MCENMYVRVSLNVRDRAKTKREKVRDGEDKERKKDKDKRRKKEREGWEEDTGGREDRRVESERQ